MKTSKSSNKTPSWRSRTLHRLQDAFPKLKRLVQRNSRKGRKALLNLLEGHRRDLLDGLAEDASGSSHDKVANLRSLLSLPLELSDLETCLHMGVAGALQDSHPASEAQASADTPFNLSAIDADAQFLAQFVVGNDTATSSLASQLAAQDPLPIFDSLRVPSTVSTRPAAPTYKLGTMAQLTAVVLMVAQLLIGVQLLRRHRKRTRAHQASASHSRSYLRSNSSDPGIHSRARGLGLLLLDRGRDPDQDCVDVLGPDPG